MALSERIGLESVEDTPAQEIETSAGIGGFADALARELESVEEVLATIPEGLAEARKIIVVSFWPSPRPEELQTLVKIAQDPASETVRAQACRMVLALRLMANRELDAFWSGMPTDTKQLRRHAAVLDGIRSSLAETRQDLTLAETGMGPLGVEDTELLRRTLAYLAPPPEPILSAVLLAPLIADILEAFEGDAPTEAVTTLSETEIQLLASEGSAGEFAAFRRCALDVAALRWMIQKMAAAWESQSANADTEEETLQALRGRAREQEQVYLHISHRLQRLQDDALMARRKAEVDLLFQIRRPLSASHATLAPVLQNIRALAQKEVAGAEDGTTGVAIEDGEFEQIFRDAVETPGAPAGAAEPPLVKADRKRRVRRIATMACAILGLGLVALGVRAFVPPPPPPPLEFSPADSISLRLSATESIGTMLYAQVTDAWDSLTPAERTRQLTELSHTALDHGFLAIHLADQHRDPVADWDREHGVRLITPPEPAAKQASAPHKP